MSPSVFNLVLEFGTCCFCSLEFEEECIFLIDEVGERGVFVLYCFFEVIILVFQVFNFFAGDGWESHRNLTPTPVANGLFLSLLLYLDTYLSR